jgi:hypothetical protein
VLLKFQQLGFGHQTKVIVEDVLQGVAHTLELFDPEFEYLDVVVLLLVLVHADANELLQVGRLLLRAIKLLISYLQTVLQLIDLGNLLPSECHAYGYQ